MSLIVLNIFFSKVFVCFTFFIDLSSFSPDLDCKRGYMFGTFLLFRNICVNQPLIALMISPAAYLKMAFQRLKAKRNVNAHIFII